MTIEMSMRSLRAAGIADGESEARGSSRAGDPPVLARTDCPGASDTREESSRAPRVLHLFNRYRFHGGEEAAVLRMSEVMRGSGAAVGECFVSSRDWEGPGAPPVWQQALLAFRNPASLRRVREQHRALGSDLWLAHNLLPVLSLGVLREAHRRNVPLALYLHNYRPFSVNGSLWAKDQLAPEGLRRSFWREIAAGSWQESIPRTAWMALLLRAAHALGWYRTVAGWIAVSNFVRDRFVEAGVPADRIHVLPYPYLPGARPIQVDKRRQFLFLGRLTVAKGTRVLLRAWEIVAAQLGATAPKLAIGGEGELRDEVLAAAASNASIEYLGSVHGGEKDRLIAGSVAMVVPSVWWDPYPTVVYEAFDQARPVLAARSGGLPESVAPGERGLLHEPGDAEQLARQVLSLHRDPALADRLGEAGRRWLLANSGADFWWTRFSSIAQQVRGPRLRPAAGFRK